MGLSPKKKKMKVKFTRDSKDKQICTNESDSQASGDQINEKVLFTSAVRNWRPTRLPRKQVKMMILAERNGHKHAPISPGADAQSNPKNGVLDFPVVKAVNLQPK